MNFIDITYIEKYQKYNCFSQISIVKSELSSMIYLDLQ